MCMAVRQFAVLDLTTEQVIRRLQSLNRKRRGELRHLPGVVVGHADVSDLAVGDQLAQRARRLGGRHGRVGPMHLVKVDVVHAQRGQAGVDSSAQPFRTCVANKAGIGLAQTTFGGDHDFVAVAGELDAERLAEDMLGRAETVGLRRVEEVDAQIAGTTDRGDGSILVEMTPVPTELPGAEGDAGNVEPSLPQCGVLHFALQVAQAHSYIRVCYEPRLRAGAAVSPPLTAIGYSPLAAIYVYWPSANTLVAGMRSATAPECARR